MDFPPVVGVFLTCRRVCEIYPSTGRRRFRHLQRSYMVDIRSLDLTAEDFQEMYRLMLMGRLFTERALELYAEGRLPTAMHPSVGRAVDYR